jgi:hypothetical protein
VAWWTVEENKEKMGNGKEKSRESNVEISMDGPMT